MQPWVGSHSQTHLTKWLNFACPWRPTNLLDSHGLTWWDKLRWCDSHSTGRWHMPCLGRHCYRRPGTRSAKAASAAAEKSILVHCNFVIILLCVLGFLSLGPVNRDGLALINLSTSYRPTACPDIKRPQESILGVAISQILGWESWGSQGVVGGSWNIIFICYYVIVHSKYVRKWWLWREIE